MGVFTRFRTAGGTSADPLGIQAAIDTIAREREALTSAQRRRAALDDALSPAAKQQAIDAASQTGRVEDLLAATKAQADAETERQVLGRFIPNQQTRIRQAQDQLTALKVRRAQVGQALQVLALQAGVADLLAAAQRMEDAAAPFARWSNSGVFDAETNPLLVRLAELRRYLTGNEPGDWATLVARAESVADSEPEALAIAMSDVDASSKPPPGTGLW